MPRIASRVTGSGTTIFTEINNLAARYDTVNLGQGKPDFDAPPAVVEAAVEAMRAGNLNQYAPGPGIAPLRQGVATHAKTFYGLDVDPDDGVVVTCGASEGVYASVLGLVNPGDEVILIEPYFDIYKPAILTAGGIPVYVPLYPPDWTFNMDELRAAFNPKTRAIIINTPHNPTGRVFTREELTQIAELCQEYDALVIADEVYEHLVYDGNQHIPMATLPGMWERTLTVSSAAKTFSVTGWKVGWAYGPPELVTGVWRIRQDITFAVNHPSQYGVAHALTFDQRYYDDYLAMYASKRAILLPALEAAGLKPFVPQGTFYIMVDFSEVFDGDDRAFAEYLIKEAGIACIPPSAFFSEDHKHLTKNHARFSFCKTDEALQQAAVRLDALHIRGNTSVE